MESNKKDKRLSDAVWEQRKGCVVECKFCGALFCELRKAVGRDRKFCSHACLRWFNSPPARPVTFFCVNCGETIQSTSRYPRAYCSDKCNRALRNDRRLNRRTLLRLLERDGDECWICGEAIDHAVRAPDRMAASIDHVVPLSFGGSSDDSNLKPAHLGCNSSRGGRMTLEDYLASGVPGRAA